MGKLKSFRKRLKTSRKSVDKFRPGLDEASKRKLSMDIVKAHFKYQIEPYEFLRFGFDYLSDAGRETFITNTTRFDYYNVFNDPEYTKLLDDKIKTYELLGEFYGREALHIHSNMDKNAFTGFAERYPEFIYKPTQAYSGKGVRIINTADYESLDIILNELLDQGEGICEELVIQSKAMASFHPESVNTVRIAAFLDGEGKLNAQWCMLRMGAGDSLIDNVSGGGMGAAIDFETGVVIEAAKDYERNTYIFHPDTNVQIVGFNLPDWDDCKSLLKEIANKVPQVRFVGWDMAHTDKGWVLIEANSHPMCGAMQITEFKGKKEAYEQMRSSFLSEK